MSPKFVETNETSTDDVLSPEKERLLDEIVQEYDQALRELAVE